MIETQARPAKAPSPVTVASNAFVAAHLGEATALGVELTGLVADPDAFVASLRRGFGSLGDAVNAEGARRIAPGLVGNLGVRLPLMEAADKAFKRGTRPTSPATILDIVDRLLADEVPEIRWFGMWNLARTLSPEAERAWQLLRRAARDAREWITVDTLAHPYGEGLIRDPGRWDELDRIARSASRWERRLVGSTLATLPHVKLPGAKDRAVVERGLPLIAGLIGDDEPDVQKALSWALRTFADLDASATTTFLEQEARVAARDRDGNRAWVIRDSLSKLPLPTAARLRADLDGIRRNTRATSTSPAANAARELHSAATLAVAGTAPGPGPGLRRNSAQ